MEINLGLPIALIMIALFGYGIYKLFQPSEDQKYWKNKNKQDHG